MYYRLKMKHSMNEKIDYLFLNFYSFLERLRVPESLLLPIIINADRYANCHCVKHKEINDLLVISTLVTHKYWTDVSYANSSIASLTQLKLKDFNAFERKFLQALQYRIGVEDCEIDEFIDKWTTNKYNIDNNNNNNNNSNSDNANNINSSSNDKQRDKEQLEAVRSNVSRMKMMYERFELNRSQ